MKIVENYPLKPYSALCIGGTARYFTEIRTKQDLPKLVSFAKQKNIPIHIIGEGTNTYFADTCIHRIFAHMQLSGSTYTDLNETTALVYAAAGRSWDQFVDETVTRGYSGLEALSAIPGTVGAAPFQNIGAYGSECSETCVAVEVFDTLHETFLTLPKEACMFAYRTSIFKQYPERYIITAVLFTLSKNHPIIPKYTDVQMYFQNTNPPHVTARVVREAIISIRSKKLPDHTKIPNVGSYFMNPIITKTQFAAIQKRYPAVPFYQIYEDTYKLFAGWLIEQVGLKGKTIHNITIDPNNALILTNQNDATGDDIQKAEAHIVQKVSNTFGITLEREPRYIT